MNQLVRDLQEGSWVLDLGAGPGSFAYDGTRARVLAVDLDFPLQAQACLGRVTARAHRLPLADASVDVVICNHTLEHFAELDGAIHEIARVLKAGGHLWAAIPDGYSLDDALYRFLFDGGGHVNRFTLPGFCARIQNQTPLRLLWGKTLYTGLVYLQPPSPEKAPYYPRKARLLLGSLPERLQRSGVRWLNYLLRLLDHLWRTHLSRYGWGLVFRREPDNASTTSSPPDRCSLEWRAADVNVCFSCGAGHDRGILGPHLGRFLFWRLYRCPSCGEKNVFVNWDLKDPGPGLPRGEGPWPSS